MSDANEEELRNSLLIEEAVDNGAQGVTRAMALSLQVLVSSLTVLI